MEKIFKVKLEDKAALLNKMEKAGMPLDSTQIKDNKLEGYFTVTCSDPEKINTINSILNQSSKINTMDKKKIKKDDLKEMIRQELQTVLAEKKKVKDEDKKEKLDESEEINEDLAGEAAPIIGTILGVGGTMAIAIVRALMKAKTPEEKKKVLQSISNQIDKSKGNV